MDKKIKGVISLIFITSIILVILIAGNDTLFSLLSVYIAMLSLSYLIYTSKDFKYDALGLSKTNLTRSFIWALILGAVVYGVASLTGIAIGVPRLPQAISDTVRSIIVLGFAPVVETIFFQGAVFAVLLNTFEGKSRKNAIMYAIIGQALLFSIAHVSAYVTGFYDYPSVAQGLGALSSNIGAFISAFIFALISMFVVLRSRISNLAFVIFFHFFVNLIVTVALAVIVL